CSAAASQDCPASPHRATRSASSPARQDCPASPHRATRSASSPARQDCPASPHRATRSASSPLRGWGCPHCIVAGLGSLGTLLGNPPASVCLLAAGGQEWIRAVVAGANFRGAIELL